MGRCDAGGKEVRLFHRHQFDPEKWKLVSAVEVMRRPVPQSTEAFHVGKHRVYSNTCKDCGDLVFRRVEEIA